VNRDVFSVFVLWVLFSAVGLAVVTLYKPFPVAAAEEALIVDGAFTFLTYLAVPIFSLVIAMLVYSGLRFRMGGTPSEDGPPIRSNRSFVVSWIIVSTVLTIVVIIHPGITGLNEIRASENKPADILVEVEGQRFIWTVTYPQYGVFSRKEMVLPVGEHARFNVTVSENMPAVLHSFWIPAFRIKIDAVPGITTRAAATPIKTGTFDEDANFRIQCAEMCGIAHNSMRLPVRIVERSEFDSWLAEQSPIRQ
jgi:cytochrome c oxidase subunit 2